MKNSIFLEKASKLQKKASKLQREFRELYDPTGLIAISDDNIQVTAKKFNKLEREEGLLQHISKKLNGIRWDYEAITPNGAKIIAVDFVKDKR